MRGNVTGIRTLLIANRAEIARRVIRTAHLMGIRTVAVYTPDDARAPHTREAGTAVAVDDYLDAPGLVGVATRFGADAVHPGYGFLAERGDAARAFAAAGVVWVGPPADVIDTLGDKVRAKELMAAAGVPVLPDRPLPVLVKAAAGGGGRGMRVVRTEAELDDAVASARREAEAAFGDGTVFLERYIEHGRHVEIQVVADDHGAVVHLGERECSIQRRHQKVVEESPSPGIDDDLRERMTAAAVAGAKAVGYRGVGTWEFLVDGDDFFFLEVNTRLQVEHPVTEAVTGLDLVRLQLEVAAGGRLDLAPTFEGAAIEVRLVAEDPTEGWVPSTGTLHRFEPGDVPGVRYDLGFENGSVVGARYDSLLGKVIAHAPTRAEAAARLALALDRFELHGVATNRAHLAGILREPDFLAGRTSTDYFETHPPVAPGPIVEHAVAAALWCQARRRRGATLPSGWRNVRSQAQRVTWRDGSTDVAVEYALDGVAFRGTRDGRIVRVDDDGIDIEVDGVVHACRCDAAGDSVWVGSGLGQSTLVEVPRFPTTADDASAHGPSAPVPGTVISVEVAPGDTVAAGQTLVVLEAM